METNAVVKSKKENNNTDIGHRPQEATIKSCMHKAHIILTKLLYCDSKGLKYVLEKQISRLIS